MQPSNVAGFLTGGVSAGIIAGVVSGLFYLVVAGFRWAGEVRLHSGEWFQKQIQQRFATPSIEDVERRNGSIMQSESSQVREFIEHLVEALVSGGIDHVNVNRLYSHPDYDRMFETYHSILCDVLARLSFALQMAIANKPLEDSDSPSAAHTELKQLVQGVVREAMTLPALHQNSVNGPALPSGKEDINSKTYEDILATAILNKVIERFQLVRLDSPRMDTDGNSNLLYRNRSTEHAPKYINSLEIGMTSGTSGSVDGMGPSSLEDVSWSESSALTEPTSLTIEECIEEEEEVTLYSSEDEEHDTKTGAELDFYLSGLNFIKRHRVPFPELGMDIVDGNEDSEGEDHGSPQPTDLVSPVDSWEENWLFQRRRLKVGGVNQPMPVPMLVPNPSEDYRALIGDQDAEETSDLSDCSEGVYEGLMDNRPEDIEVRLSRLSQELSDDDSIGDFVLLPGNEFELAEARNEEIANSVDSSSELGQQDSEYTEDYASVTQRQMNSLKRQHNLPEDSAKPVPKPRKSVQSNASESAAIISNCDTPLIVEAVSPLDDLDPMSKLATPPRPGTELSQDDICMNQAWTGTIAEREHKKWESAAPLPNNPYSSENILKRLSKSSLLDIRSTCSEKVELSEKTQLPKVEKISVQQSESANISRYGRDYYVNSSRLPSSAFGQHLARPVEIVMASEVDHPAKSSAMAELPQKEIAESAQHVESAVSRLQKEINEQEELWMKNIKSPKNQTDLKINKPMITSVDCSTADANGIINITESDDRPKTPQEIIEEKILEHMTPKNIVIIENNINTPSNNQKSKADIESLVKKSESKSLLNSKTNTAIKNPKKLTNGDNKCAVNGKKPKMEDILASGSESSLLSSDNEGNIPMPSVKNLAKQFSARNNTLLVPQVASPVSKLVDRTKFSKAASQKTGLPMREVHSLTARSISREFREELKRNLPTQLDRNMHASDSCPSQQSSSDLETSTTPGYTSDESNSISPVPGLLRNNIAFWEQIQRNNK